MEKNKEDRHHIYPQSRFPELRLVAENIVLIDKLSHTKYHALFANMSPQEIAAYLAGYFWGRNPEIIEKVINTLVDMLPDNERSTR